jgi:hypothetical protein
MMGTKITRRGDQALDQQTRTIDYMKRIARISRKKQKIQARKGRLARQNRRKLQMSPR